MVDTDDTRSTTDDSQWTTTGVWHNLPTGEPKTIKFMGSVLVNSQCRTSRKSM